MFKSRPPELVEAPVRGLLGPALAWAVADTLGHLDHGEMYVTTFTSKPGFLPLFTRKYDYRWPCVCGHKFDPMSPKNFAHGIILQICEKVITAIRRDGALWRVNIGEIEVTAGTLGYAVLRCYVLHHRGEFVKVPAEFV